MKLTALPALKDNYIWVLEKNKKVIVIDPGDAKPVLSFLSVHQVELAGILITHYHDDHIAGVFDLLNTYPNTTIFAPNEVAKKLDINTINIVKNGDSFSVLNENPFFVIKTPGHTLEHVCYYNKPYLFSGDTLFSAGCGRLFEGLPQNMFYSLKKLLSLPSQTLLCCGHEYTLTNLQFAHSVFPENIDIQNALEKTQELRSKLQITLPSTLEIEKKINPFLIAIENDSLETFTQLRQLRNQF